jgi:hypothetical protein
MIHATDEREHAKGYNVSPRTRLGYRPPSLEAIRGPVST